MSTANADDATSNAANKGSIGHDGRVNKRIGKKNGHDKQSDARMKQRQRPHDNSHHGCRCRSLPDDFNATKTSTRSNTQRHQAMPIMVALHSLPNDSNRF